MRQREIDRTIGRAPPRAVAVEAQHRLVGHLPQQRELLFGERGAERRNGGFIARRHHRDDVDIAFDRDDGRALMRGLPRGRDVVERRALVEERRLVRVQVFRRRILVERAPAERDDAPAQVGDRKHHAVAEAIVRHRNVFAVHQQPGLDHVLGGNALRAERFLQREALGRRVADAEAQLRLRLDAAVGQIAARLGAGTGLQCRFKELRRKLDDVVQRLAPLLARLGLARGFRHRHARHRGEPLDRLGERHPLGLHHEIEDVAVLARGEIEPRRLLVVHEEGRRLLLVERREPLPLAARLLERHATADDLRNREARAQVVEELGRKTHGDSGALLRQS